MIDTMTLLELSQADRDSGKQDLAQLSERHKMIMRLELMGKNKKQIATITGYAYQTVIQITNSRNYKQVKRAMQAELDEEFIRKVASNPGQDPVKQILDNAKVTAMELNAKMMQNAESENVQQRAIFDILDRAGYKPKDVVQTDSTINLPDEVRDNITQALRDLQKIEPKDEPSDE